MTETRVIFHERKREDETPDSLPFGVYIMSEIGDVYIKTDTEDFVDLKSGVVSSLEEFKEDIGSKFKIIHVIDIWFDV
jgi:hypothetical protein